MPRRYDGDELPRYRSYADQGTTIADKAERITQVFFGAGKQKGNPAGAAASLQVYITNQTHFLAMVANPRNVDDDVARSGVAAAAIFSARNNTARAEEFLSGGLNIMEGIIERDTGEGRGKKTLAGNASILAYYLEGLSAYEKQAQKPWGITAAEFAERIRTEQPRLLAEIVAINPALNSFFPEVKLQKPAAAPQPIAAQEIVTPSASTIQHEQTKIVNGQYGERSYYSPRFLRRNAPVSEALIRADDEAKRHIAAGDMAKARMVYEAHLKGHGPLLTEDAYLRYVSTFPATGNPATVKFVLAPHVKENGRLSRNAEAHVLYEAALAVPRRTQGPLRTDAPSGQAPKPEGE